MEKDVANGQSKLDVNHPLPFRSRYLKEDDGSKSRTRKSISFLDKMKGLDQRKLNFRQGHIQNQSCSNLTAKCFSVLHKELIWTCHGVGDFRPPPIFGIVCFASPQVFLPVDLRCLRNFYDFSKSNVQEELVNAFGDAVFQVLCQFHPGNIGIKIYGSVQRSDTTRDHLKAIVCIRFTSSVQRSDTTTGHRLKAVVRIHFTSVFSNMRSTRLKSPDIFRINEAHFSHSAAMSSCPPQKVGEKIACSGKHRPRPLSYDQTLISLEDGVSASECQTEPPEYANSLPSHAAMEGLLRVIWKGGVPYFTFSQVDGEDYAAIPRKMNSTIDKDLDCVYFFYKMAGNGRVNYANNLYGSLGIMVVSSHATYDSDITKRTETEFVLYDSIKNNSVEKQSSISDPRKKRRFPRMVRHAFQKDQSDRKNTAHRSTEDLRFKSQITLNECDVNELKQLWQKHDHAELIHHLQPSLELAAIVIRGYDFNEQTMDSGGWGLKFLQKHVDAKSRLSNDLSIPLESCIADGRGSARRIDVLIPSGFHSFQETGTVRPYSLIERWKSGRCDCSGWDLGCPLYVIRSSAADEGQSEEEPQEDHRIVNLVKEGHRTSQASIRVQTIHNNLYVVHFHSNLPAIRSFSIGLSVIHSHIKPLCPNP